MPLREHDDFSLDADRVVRAAGEHTKIVFVCSPNNPTGGSIPRLRIEAICDALAGRALVVIDEAYHEFANAESCLHLRERYEHVVLLRTLSKCVALAGARCGALIAAPEVIEFLGGVLPPYTFRRRRSSSFSPPWSRIRCACRRADSADQTRAAAARRRIARSAGGGEGLSERREFPAGPDPRCASVCRCGAAGGHPRQAVPGGARARELREDHGRAAERQRSLVAGRCWSGADR